MGSKDAAVNPHARWFVAIAGNIGVGKSTLVERLSHKLGWAPFYEPVGENPYLADFYDDMQQWAFPSQVFFLTRRLQAHHQLTSHPTSAIQDRTVYEDAEVFAQNLSERGYMTGRDHATYRELYDVLKAFLPPPDLVVYLRASVDTLLTRIAARGRARLLRGHVVADRLDHRLLVERRAFEWLV